ncbi:hypothetical protein BDY19DRAFT_992742 [Irpex rosettiformis]|uniref:Uncharacterized protein n=1 Tax=Irpex rosettiformis TaxID=378272 RepID=A0ACB8U5X5_9APHY|nr:hypothetical protein BDY19DRAFT_992742 [Irpex rosettiformis]
MPLPEGLLRNHETTFPHSQAHESPSLQPPYTPTDTHINPDETSKRPAQPFASVPSNAEGSQSQRHQTNDRREDKPPPYSEASNTGDKLRIINEQPTPMPGMNTSGGPMNPEAFSPHSQFGGGTTTTTTVTTQSYNCCHVDDSCPSFVSAPCALANQAINTVVSVAW